MTESCANITAEEIWRKYEKGLQIGNRENRFNRTEECWRFFEGDQWFGLDTGGKQLPFMNIIRPVINYKKAKVAMNNKTITLSITEEGYSDLMDAINETLKQAWEYGKMDSVCWELTERAFVGGDSYVFFPHGTYFSQQEKRSCRDRRRFCQIIENTQIFLGDEEEPEIQRQPYIIVEAREQVRRVQREAEKNGLSKEEIDDIRADGRSEAEITTGQKETEDGKVTTLLYMTLTEGGLMIGRSTKRVIYQTMRLIPGLHYYPLEGYVVGRQKGKARGKGEVYGMIPNQIEINKTLYRRSVAIKQASFPKLVYNNAYVQDAAAIEEVGASGALDADQTLGSIENASGYIQPANRSGDARNYQKELINDTKELAGAGDAALGNVNPEQASGAAITAAIDQSDIPMNREISDYAQMIENIATVWFHMILAYNPTGFKYGEGKRIAPEALEALCPEIKADVSSTVPQTQQARINTLYSLLGDGHISFDEFLDLSGSDSNIPIEKLRAMREQANQEAMEADNAAADAELEAIRENREREELSGEMTGAGEAAGIYAQLGGVNGGN